MARLQVRMSVLDEGEGKLGNKRQSLPLRSTRSRHKLYPPIQFSIDQTSALRLDLVVEKPFPLYAVSVKTYSASSECTSNHSTYAVMAMFANEMPSPIKCPFVPPCPSCRGQQLESRRQQLTLLRRRLLSHDGDVDVEPAEHRNSKRVPSEAFHVVLLCRMPKQGSRRVILPLVGGLIARPIERVALERPRTQHD
jgi:hypothetical protein